MDDGSAMRTFGESESRKKKNRGTAPPPAAHRRRRVEIRVLPEAWLQGSRFGGLGFTEG